MSSGKIKILYTIPNFETAGSGIVVKKLVERLDKNIFEPHVCCFHNRGKLYTEVEQAGATMHVFQYTTPMNNKLKGLLACYRISRFFKQFDLIFSYHYADDYSEGLAAKMAGVPWLYVKKNMSWGSNAWNLRSKLAKVINVQNSDMLALFFKGSKKTVYIPIGVDTDEFKPREAVTSLYNEFNINTQHPIILTVANLVPVKGVEVLIKAFNLLDRSKWKPTLLIVGNDQTTYAAQVKQLADESPNKNQIIFTGKRSDIKDFMSIADVYVQSSWNEASPISLLEAMASDVVSLGSNTGGMKDQLKEVPDQLFTTGDEHALAEKLMMVLNASPDWVTRRKKIQQDTVQKIYTLTQEVKQHEALYKKVLGR
jgi:glycosyltransferase involved in cell wall biosynthesis